MANSIFRKPINNYKEIQERVFAFLGSTGATGSDTLSAYPTKPGVYRVGSPSGIAGLPSGITGYGALLVGNAGSYCFHYYIDNNKRLYWAMNTATGNSTSIVSPPAKWYYAVGTEVNAAS